MTDTDALTHEEFVELFVVPEDTKQAFNFGQQCGYFLRKKLSYEEFFKNDGAHRKRRAPRDSLWRAYRRGYKTGRARRTENDAKRGRVAS